ncbi:MAG: H-type lectin domain-containing protein [Pseudomonadota bacterium]
MSWGLRRISLAPVGLACAMAAAVSPEAHARRLEAGRVTTLDTFATAAFTSVTFQQPFDTIPVVVSLPTTQGGDSSALRIRNVTTTGFEIAAVEPTGNDGPHVSMTVDYVAMEPGILTLPGGGVAVAGFHTTSTVQRAGVVGGPSGWDAIGFGTALPATAAVIADIQTMNSETGAPPGAPSIPWLTVVMRNPTTSGVEIALERSEVSAGSVAPETIGWIAFPQGLSGAFSGVNGGSVSWRASGAPTNIVGYANTCVTNVFSPTAWTSARVVAAKTSRNGSDGGWLRRCSLSSTTIGLQVDEDIANDSDRSHIAEAAAILAFSDSFHATFEGDLTAAKTVSIEEDPVTGAGAAYAIPGARARYAIRVDSVGNAPIDADTVSFVDAIPADVSMIVADIGVAGSGPVRFLDGTPSSNLTYAFGGLSDPSDDLEFSNDGGLTFTYTPTAQTDGSDPAVTHIRVQPKGAFAEAAGGATPYFVLEFDALVR